MAWTPPRETPYSLERGQRGVKVWSLQRGLNDAAAYGLAEDGNFGPLTEQGVIAWQTTSGLVKDGVAGPRTQRALAARLLHRREAATPGLPVGLADGFAESEGGWLLAAVNWGVAGGVDCGVFQRRVADSRGLSREEYDRTWPTGAKFDSEAVERAFDTDYQASLLLRSLRDRHDAFAGRAGTLASGSMAADEKAWRLAALNHNYPEGADRLSRTPVSELSGYWTAPAAWVESIGARFPDGVSVRTPLEWCHHYAGVLNGAHGTRGSVTRYVTRW